MRTFFLIILFFFTLNFFVFADNSNKTQKEKKWVLALSTFKTDDDLSELTTMIPTLIAKNLPSGLIRLTGSDELYEREKQEIEKKNAEILKTLNQKRLERDSLILQHISEKKLQKNIAEVDVSIKSNEDFLRENQKIMENLFEKKFENTSEPVVFFNSGAIQENADDFLEDKIKNHSVDFDALLVGSVERFDSFIQVSTQLILFPGELKTDLIVETASIDDLDFLTRAITNQLALIIENRAQANLKFSFDTQESFDAANVYIDGNKINPSRVVVQKNMFSKTITAGIHEITIRATGYKNALIRYYFEQNETYAINVALIKLEPANIRLQVPETGSLYLNGVLQKNTKDVIAVNNFPQLGEYISEDSINTRFVLKEGNNFKPQIETTDYVSRVEKNRKRMYTSYAALILSLPAAFLVYGNYVNEHNSYIVGKNVPDNINAWKIAHYSTVGVSVALSINFLVQLGIYIHSVNAVLPKELKQVD